MNNEAKLPTDGTTQHGQAVVQSNMQELFNLAEYNDSAEQQAIQHMPFTADPLLLTSQMVGDILHKYYGE